MKLVLILSIMGVRGGADMSIEVYDVERKVVRIGEQMFTVDIADTGNGVYAVRGVNTDGSIDTNWIRIDGEDPVQSAVNLMEFEVRKRTEE